MGGAGPDRNFQKCEICTHEPSLFPRQTRHWCFEPERLWAKYSTASQWVQTIFKFNFLLYISLCKIWIIYQTLDKRKDLQRIFQKNLENQIQKMSILKSWIHNPFLGLFSEISRFGILVCIWSKYFWILWILDF